MSGYCSMCGEKVCVCAEEPIVTNAMVQRDLQADIDKLDRIASELQDTCHKQAMRIEELEQQRDELLAALEKAIEFVPAGYGIERQCWEAIKNATDHRHACTGSNEPGQAGSAYAECKPHNAGIER